MEQILQIRGDMYRWLTWALLLATAPLAAQPQGGNVATDSDDWAEAREPVLMRDGTASPFVEVVIDADPPDVAPRSQMDPATLGGRVRVRYDRQRWSTRFPWLAFETHLGRQTGARRVRVRTSQGLVRAFDIVGAAGSAHAPQFSYAIHRSRVYVYDAEGRVSVHRRTTGLRLEEVGAFRGYAVQLQPSGRSTRWTLLPLLGRRTIGYALVHRDSTDAYLVGRNGEILRRENIRWHAQGEQQALHVRDTADGLVVGTGDAPMMVDEGERPRVPGRDVPFVCFF